MPLPQHLLPFLITFALMGCQAGKQESKQPSPTQGEETESAEFILHEWGLINFDKRSHARLGTSRFESPEPAPAKPIIYLNPLDGFDFDTEISVEVSLHLGDLRELWPRPPKADIDPEQFRWPSIRLLKDGCAGEIERPKRLSSCADFELCEVLEMGEYIQARSHCLQAFGIKSPVLLYNGYRAPLYWGRLEDGRLSSNPQELKEDEEEGTLLQPIRENSGEPIAELSNTSPLDLGPIYVNRLPRDFCRIEELPSDTSLPINDTNCVSLAHEELETILLADLRAQGLLEDEIQDYSKAWSFLIEQPLWDSYGFVAPHSIDMIAELQVRPKPKEIRRVLAFVVSSPFVTMRH